MLTNALVTTSLGFGCLYPLFFWVNDREVVKTGFIVSILAFVASLVDLEWLVCGV